MPQEKRIPYTLRDRDMLRRIMKHPGRGESYTSRTLATDAKCPSSTIGHLLSGERRTVRMEYAHAISETLGVAVLILFVPPVSPICDKSSLS